MSNSHSASRAQQLLLELGVVLFLLGLLTGFAIPLMENPRVGLSSHLEGVLNGVFLIALGSVWHRLRLSGRVERIAIGLAVFGAFANWLATLLAGLWGTGAMMPIAAPGREAAALQESVVAALLISLSIAMPALCVIVIVGLRRRVRPRSPRRSALSST